MSGLRVTVCPDTVVGRRVEQLEDLVDAINCVAARGGAKTVDVSEDDDEGLVRRMGQLEKQLAVIAAVARVDFDPVADAVARLEEENVAAAWALVELWWFSPDQAAADLERWPVR